MEVYKAKRDGTAVFLTPDKFDEFWEKGYLIYKVNDLEDESQDELLSKEEIKLCSGQNFMAINLN